MIRMRKVGIDLYDAEATPPHVRVVWQSAFPLSGEALTKELLSKGSHQRDVGDAMYEANPDWLTELRRAS